VNVVFYETVRRHLANAGFLVLLAAISAVSALVGAFAGPVQIWQGLVKLLAVILACQLIGPEFSSGTLQLILAKPVNRSAYLVGRFFGVVVTIWILMIVPFVVDAGGRAFVSSSEPEWASMIAVTANSMLALVLVAALMAFYGSFTRSYFNVAVYVLVQLLFATIVGSLTEIQRGLIQKLAAMGAYLTAHPAILKTAAFLHEQIDPTPPQEFSLNFAMMIAANSAIAILLGAVIFSRREVPYGAD
jgi:ABC-type transport system involved in multi-copper enzyme maturation permease subunit